ncbi:hypothetical protein HBH56_116690 [Parastagonospora nodorum]|nr:hypothetical protein HBH56_116690 [Parastagonospora nodorum]KAH4136543.1 hypothetical protein HBH45_132450 [Parastagonospora nodorum]KAH4410185.1 hypothetical protein HBH92_128740 [Parastagonospora nodorum]KAH4539377.1 hypothetical protein HBH85_135640 [Parastagonospora nodorum]KAH4564008.1 hypothetical protein HBH84_166490 [Parastagonospora nodorum]
MRRHWRPVLNFALGGLWKRAIQNTLAMHAVPDVTRRSMYTRARFSHSSAQKGSISPFTHGLLVRGLPLSGDGVSPTTSSATSIGSLPRESTSIGSIASSPA